MDNLPVKISNVTLSKTAIVSAFVTAGISDAVSVWAEFVPPVQWGVDIVTAIILFAILKRQWLLLPALIAEAIPGIAMFPTWLLVVAAIALGKQSPHLPPTQERR